MIYFVYLFTVVLSTIAYCWLHKKTHISLHYLYKDNILDILVTCYVVYLVNTYLCDNLAILLLTTIFILPMSYWLFSMLRFYRVPLRKTNKKENGIVSPADGNVIYIKKIPSGVVPMSVKNGVKATLNEFTNTGILDTPCWLIGINMTPFDVHKNCAPVDGKIILNKHFNGEFLSLKHEEALSRNERNTIVLENPKGKVGVVQTASKRVRRIVTYKSIGDEVKKGEWYGMIKFGSQVDIILPINCNIKIALKQQVYAKKTIIAEW